MFPTAGKTTLATLAGNVEKVNDLRPELKQRLWLVNEVKAVK